MDRRVLRQGTLCCLLARSVLLCVDHIHIPFFFIAVKLVILHPPSRCHDRNVLLMSRESTHSVFVDPAFGSLCGVGEDINTLRVVPHRDHMVRALVSIVVASVGIA